MPLFFPVAIVGPTAAPSWTPSSISPAAWWDVSDLSTLWQDTAATTPVTADGQSVARINDKSGNSINFTQATSGARPLYKTSSGLHWLQFDGTDDQMSASAISNVITASTYEMGVAGRFSAVDTNSTTAHYNNDPIFSDVGRYVSLPYARSTGIIGAGNWDANNDQVDVSYTIGTDFVWSQRHVGGTLYGALNGGADSSVASGNTGSVGGVLRIGYGGVASSFLNGRFYAGVFSKTELSTTNRANLKTWLASKAGVTL